MSLLKTQKDTIKIKGTTTQQLYNYALINYYFNKVYSDGKVFSRISNSYRVIFN